MVQRQGGGTWEEVEGLKAADVDETRERESAIALW